MDPIGEDTQETEDKEGDDGKEGRWILARASRSLFFFASLPKPNIAPEKNQGFQKGGRFAGVMLLFCCTPWKINMDHNHGGLEDNFPF